MSYEGFPGGVVDAEEHESIREPGIVGVMDFGGQYVGMVCKAVERLGIPAEILPLDTPIEEIEARCNALILSGSPASSISEGAPQPDPAIWQSQLATLGICYGMQAMVVAHGGTVVRNAVREDGRITTTVDTKHPLFAGGNQDMTALFTHGDFVTGIPEGFSAIGQHRLSDGTSAYSAIASGNKIGVQFHPEVTDDSPDGHQVFKNFLYGIAGLEPDPSFQTDRMERLIADKRREIAEQVGDRHVIAFISGGVDSSVAAVLTATVVEPDKFHGYYIDTGFMRDEDDQVIEFLQAGGIHVTKVDAVARFEAATAEIDGEQVGPLAMTTDPETKRKIIGKAFVGIQNDLLAELQLPEAILLQGTNAADRIESGHSTGGNQTMTIKTHHNQVTEIQELKARGQLLEPLYDLFKNEVRLLGRELGLPDDLIERQPFPGPGTAIRIIATRETQDTPDISERQELDESIREFLEHRGYDQRLIARVLPVRSVGVGGDERSHKSVVALGHDHLRPEDMSLLASEIPAHFRDNINRVVYALGPQPLDNYSITETLLTQDSRNQLRHADKIVFDTMRELELLGQIKQMPVILLPLSFGEPGGRSIVVRPVTTSTFMTVQAMLPERDLPSAFFDHLTHRITSEVPGITQVFLDLTNKPPGTTEWE